MKALRPAAGFTIFIIFFGIALIESIREGDLLLILFWICMGLMFAYADSKKKQN
jgi:hypothetical protein